MQQKVGSGKERAQVRFLGLEYEWRQALRNKDHASHEDLLTFDIAADGVQ